MGKFFYTHFGDDVPRHIEDEYNKLRPVSYTHLTLPTTSRV